MTSKINDRSVPLPSASDTRQTTMNAHKAREYGAFETCVLSIRDAAKRGRTHCHCPSMGPIALIKLKEAGYDVRQHPFHPECEISWRLYSEMLFNNLS